MAENVKSSMRYAHSSDDVPFGPHLAVLIFKTISTPGWGPQDSPGSEEVCDYIVFTNEDEWQKWIESETLREGYGRVKFVAIRNGERVQIKRKVVLE